MTKAQQKIFDEKHKGEYEEIKKRLSKAPTVSDLIEIGRKKNMLYCVRMGIFLKICKSENCTFNLYKCPARS